MYARLVATLDPCAPDLAPELVQQLKGEFRFRVSIRRLSSPWPKYIKIGNTIGTGVSVSVGVIFVCWLTHHCECNWFWHWSILQL